jgi:hypothetical protein
MEARLSAYRGILITFAVGVRSGPPFGTDWLILC